MEWEKYNEKTIIDSSHLLHAKALEHVLDKRVYSTDDKEAKN